MYQIAIKYYLNQVQSFKWVHTTNDNDVFLS